MNQAVLPPIWGGLHEALLGFTEPRGGKPIAVYSYDKAVEVMMRLGMSYEDAVEYLEFNVLGAYIGEQTPLWVHPIEECEFWNDIEDFPARDEY